MVNQDLVAYIKEAKTQNLSLESVSSVLMQSGWPKADIDEAMAFVDMEGKAPKPPLPVPPAPPGSPSASAPVPSHKPRQPNFTSPYSAFLAIVLVVSLLVLAQNAVTDLLNKFAPSSESYYSSTEYKDYQKDLRDYEKANPRPSYNYSDPNYSSANQRWYQEYDAKNTELYKKYELIYNSRGVSISTRMLFHTLIVLPFWIITFLLALSLRGDRRRYHVLLLSYYITSGWLLIFLFFHIAKYIYNSNSTIGVYVSFALLAIVLTGAIWGVQRYRHRLEE